MYRKPHKYQLLFGDIIVTVKEFRQSQHTRIIVHRDCTVTLSCPIGTSKDSNLNYLMNNKEWLYKALKSMKEKPQEPTTCISEFRSKKHVLEYKPHEKNFIKIEILGEIVLVNYPKVLDICNIQVQKAAFKAISLALTIEAKEYIPKRLHELATRNQLTYKQLGITNWTSCWGRCYSDKSIMISCQTMRLPYELIDLVLIHELAHTIYMNHSEKFHALVNKMLPEHNEKQLNKEIRKYIITKPK